MANLVLDFENNYANTGTDASFNISVTNTGTNPLAFDSTNKKAGSTSLKLTRNTVSQQFISFPITLSEENGCAFSFWFRYTSLNAVGSLLFGTKMYLHPGATSTSAFSCGITVTDVSNVSIHFFSGYRPNNNARILLTISPSSFSDVTKRVTNNGNWNHICWGIDSTGKNSLLVNGVDFSHLWGTIVTAWSSAQDATRALATTRTFFLVQNGDTNSNFGNGAGVKMTGNIDSFKYFNRALTISEMQNLYTTNEISGGMTLQDYVIAGYTATQLKELGYTATQLKSVNFTAPQLKVAGYAATELKDASYTIDEMISAGYTTTELKTAGYTAAEMKTAGYSATELKAAGYTATELKAAAYTGSQLYVAGYTATEMKTAAFTASQLKAVGYTASEMKVGSYTAAEMIVAGYTATEMKVAGFTATELKVGGYTASQMKEAGFTVSELIDAQYSLLEIADGGFYASDMRNAGITILQVQSLNFYSFYDIVTAGYSISERISAGYTAQAMRENGFLAFNLYESYGFTPLQLFQAGYQPGDLIGDNLLIGTVVSITNPMPELIALGYTLQQFKADTTTRITFNMVMQYYTPAQLKAAGYTAVEMKTGNYTALDLKLLGYTLAELKTANYSVTEMQSANYTASELKAGGYNAYDFRLAGYTLSELINLGYGAFELKQAGFTTPELKQAGFTATQLKQEGFDAYDLRGAEFYPSELRIAGFSVVDLINGGFTTNEIVGAGYPAIELRNYCTISQMKRSGYTVREVKDAGYPITEIKEEYTDSEIIGAGYNAIDLKNAGYTAVDLKNNYTVTELISAGYTAENVISAGYSANDLKSAGFTISQLKIYGYTDAQILTIGYTAGELRSAAYTASQLKPYNYTSSQLRTGGYTASQVLSGGYTRNEVLQAGYTISELRSAGFNTSELRIAGYTIAQLLAAGITSSAILGAGYSAADLRIAGFTISQLKQSNYTDASILAAGFSSGILYINGYKANQLYANNYTALDLKNGGYLLSDILSLGYSAASLKEASISGSDLKNASYTAMQLIEGGYSKSDVIGLGYGASDLKIAGFTASELRANNATINELKLAGYSDSEILGAGFTASVLKTGLYSAIQLQTSGYTLLNLRDAGYSANEIIMSGFSVSLLRSNGYTSQQLKNNGFNVANLKTGGYSDSDVLNVGYSADELKTNGYSAISLKNSNYDAISLKLAGYTDSEILTAGFTSMQLRLANYSASQLRANGYTIDQLKSAGYTVQNILTAGYSTTDLKSANYTASQLRQNGFTVANLVSGGYTANEILPLNYSANALLPYYSVYQLKSYNYTPNQLKLGGFNDSDILTAEFNSTDLRRAGYSAVQLKENNYTISDLESAGYSKTDILSSGFVSSVLKSNNYLATDLRQNGYSISELMDGGYTDSEILAAGYDAFALNAMLYTAAQLYANNYTASQLKTGNYSDSDILNLGYSVQQLKLAGYLPTDLKTIYADQEILSGGFSAANLKDAEYTASQLKLNSYSVAQLISANYDANDILAAGFDASELKTNEYTASDLNGYYTAEQLRVAGYTVSDLQNGNFSTSDILTAGYLASPLRIAGYTSVQLKANNYSALELRTGGYPDEDILSIGYSIKELAVAEYTVEQMRSYGYSDGTILTGLSNTIETKPIAPVITDITSGNSKVFVHFTDSNTNDIPIIGYKYTLNGGETTLWSMDNTSPLTILGLTNGASYDVGIYAVNRNGLSVVSNIFNSVAPLDIPNKPYILNAVSENGIISFDYIIENTNGSNITDYYYSVDNTNYIQIEPINDKISISGLNGNQIYTISIKVKNAVGFSEKSNSITIKNIGLMAVPTITDITYDNKVASINYTINSTLNKIFYKYSLNDEPYVYFKTQTNPLLLTNLMPNQTYNIKIKSEHFLYGESNESNMVTLTPVTEPSKSTILTANYFNQLITLNVIEGNDNGSSITHYYYSINESSYKEIDNIDDGIITINAVIDTTISNSIKIKSENEIGMSEESNALILSYRILPDKPIITSVVAGDKYCTVNFIEGETYNASILCYKYKLSNSSKTYIAKEISNPLIITNLTNGTDYTIKIKVVCDSGESEYSNISETFMPFGIPEPPTITSLEPRVRSILVNFEPGSNGGLEILGYKYSINGGTLMDAPTNTSPMLITGLVDKLSFSVTLYTFNSQGMSQQSNTLVCIPGVPTAPTINSVTSTSGTFMINYTPSAINNGNAVTKMFYTFDNINMVAFSSMTNPLIIKNMLNGRFYNIAISSFSTVGFSPLSNRIMNAIIKVPPNVLLIESVSLFLESASTCYAVVRIKPPVDNGFPITGYKYALGFDTTYTPIQGTSVPLIIPNLPVNTGIAMKLVATNENGDSQPSALTKTARYVLAAPASPAKVAATTLLNTMRITFTKPAINGAEITTYKYSLNDGPFVSLNSNVVPFNIPINNNTLYNVRVIATNIFGDSAPSAPLAKSVSYVYLSPLLPKINSIVGGNNTLDVFFTASTTRGADVTGYSYSLDAGVTIVNTTTTTSPLTITGLTNGTNYSVLLYANSGAGLSAPSVAMSGLPVYAVPDAPVIKSIIPLNNSCSITLNDPVINGSPITTYLYSIDGGVTLLDTNRNTTSFLISGLTNGTNYNIQIVAVNALGNSLISLPKSVMPIYSEPSAPVLTKVSAGVKSFTITFTSSVPNGSAIISYYYSLDNGVTMVNTNRNIGPITISNLSSFVTYNVRLYALNDVGYSPASNSMSVTTR